MDDSLRPRIAAARLLRWLEEQESLPGTSATPIDLLARHLGLQTALFHPESRRSGTLGWLEPGENLIFLRQGLSEPVRRFTLAHEIGHAVLHRIGSLDSITSLKGLTDALLPGTRDLLMPETDAGCEDSDLDAPLTALTPGEELLRPGEAYSARARRESEANAFAAALLLPPERLRSRYLARMQQQQHQFTTAGRRRSSVTQSLAREFGVSEDVILRGLAALLQAPALPAELVTGEVPVASAAEPASVVERQTHQAQLDPSQRRAATATAPALIVAGPGTGKTSTLVGRVAYLIEEQNVPAEAILALTFSNKAAREMSERLDTLLRHTTTSATATIGLPAMPTVSTIHAFCGDLVRRYAPLVGLRPDFRLIGEAEGYFLLRQIASELVLHHYQPLATPGLHFPALLAAISRAKDELAGPERYAAVAEAMLMNATNGEERYAAERAYEVATVYLAYQSLLTERGDADFGDVIRLAVQLLREHPVALAEVQAHYQQVLVDEFQDINRAMGVLLHTLTGDTASLWAVGDADQAIYRFRGASPANLAHFTNDYPQAQIHALQRNYRSAPDILIAASGLAGATLGDGERRLLEATRSQAGAAITLAVAPQEAAELAGLAESIQRRAESGRGFGEQVVLCRTRRQCQRVAAALTAAHIPVQLAAPLLEQDPTKDLLGVLGLPGDLSGSGLLRAGNLPDHTFSQQDARAVLAAARVAHQAPLLMLLQGLDTIEGLTPAGREGLAKLARIILELRQAPDVVVGISRYVFNYTRIGQRLLRQALGAEGVAPSVDAQAGSAASRIGQLLGLAHAFEDQQRSQQSAASREQTPTHAKRADWTAFLEYVRVMLVLRQETGNNSESSGQEDASVRVLTVHASKGLEFPVVYLPGLADRRFPMQRQANSTPLLPGLSEDDTAEAHDPDAHLAEEACLFYVALTRARDELVLSRAERYGRMRYKPSPFLAPIETALQERLLREEWLTVPETQHSEEDSDRAEAQEQQAPVAPIEPLTGPVRHSAIETYQRCPRQYAYRYVYGLRPREIGIATLRRTLHDTLHTLHQRFARPGRYVANGQREKISLEDALTLFESEWSEKLEQERRSQNSQSSESSEGNENNEDESLAAENALDMPTAVAGDAFLEVYRRHGRHVIERAWTGLVQRQLPGMAIQADALVFDAEETHFDELVTVQVGSRTLSVLLDRVERGTFAPTVNVAPANAVSSAAQMTSRKRGKGSVASNTTGQSEPAPAEAAPVRLVRHRLGRGNGDKADLHALFYALAAQQSGAPTAAFYSHNLSTGEVEQITLDERKMTKLLDELDSMLDGIEHGLYPAKPDPNRCQSCPFLLICPA